MKEKVRLHLQTAKPQFTDVIKNVVLAPWAMPKANDICSAEVLPYYGSNPEILHENFRKTWLFYPIIVKWLSERLNSNLAIKNSPLDWEILLGYWLFYTLDVFFDKQSTLESAFKHYEIEEVSLYHSGEIQVDNLSTYDFLHKLYGKPFHEALYSLIFSILYEENNVHQFQVQQPRALKETGKDEPAINFTRSYRYSFSECQFSVGNLRDCLGEPGHKEIPVIRPVSPSHCRSTRNAIATQLVEERICETALSRILAFSLPTCFLEGYEANVQLACVHYPKNIGLIYTSNSYAHNDLFKFWVVASRREGSKYIIGQHGNNYGNLKWNSTEEYELRVADHFVSWGWGHKKPKIKVLPSITLNQFATRCPKPNFGSKRILFVSYSLPSYQYFSHSLPQGNQHFETMLSWVDFIDQIIDFDVVFRPHMVNYNWNETEFIIEKCNPRKLPSISQGKKLLNDLKDSSLCVITYNSTVILQLIYANFPFVCFWNPDHWQICPEMEKSYQILRQNNILHDTARGAADFINNLDENIEVWWNSQTTREAIDKFCDSFLERNSNPEEKWKDCFEGILRS